MKETNNTTIFHTYDTTPSLEFAGDDFGYYMEEIFEPYEDPEQIYRQRADRKRELDELAKSYVRKRLTNEEAIAYWKETGKWEEISSKLYFNKESWKIGKNSLTANYAWTSVCEPGPLRAEPGLVGIWKQEGEREWRQLGLTLHEDWIFRVTKEPQFLASPKKGRKKSHKTPWDAWCYHFDIMDRWAMLQIGTARTCRYLIWQSSDRNDHYKSAFYSREELEYLSESRATFNDLLDCSLLYAADEIRPLLDMPVVDYMFLMQHPEYLSYRYTPEQLTESFYKQAFKAMSTNVHKFNVVFPIGCRQTWYVEGRDVTNLYNPRATDLNMLIGFYDAMFYFRECLLIDYLTAFRLLEEHGLNAKEFVKFDKKGEVDKVIKYYKRLEEWIDLYGVTPLYDDDITFTSHMWIITLMDREGLNYVYYLCKRRGYSLEDACDLIIRGYECYKISLEPDGMSIPSEEDKIFYKIMKQVYENPALDAETDRLWRFVAGQYFKGWCSQEEWEEYCWNYSNNRFGRKVNAKTHLSDAQSHKLLDTLPLFNLTEDEFWDMSDDEFKLLYHGLIKAAHPDAGGDANEAVKINVAYKILMEFRQRPNKD